ncbi:peroxisome 1 [Perilla frutescens var. hirtella]|uniref:Peroxisomal ATPase PEX1 n=1 Tax=Perilla frutescens var. hirtella TaxID=608512 RepID=A0AAD4JFD6_PERFH|nr:peroxisome 1 [Perilla frutescens var. hirtella]
MSSENELENNEIEGCPMANSVVHCKHGLAPDKPLLLSNLAIEQAVSIQQLGNGALNSVFLFSENCLRPVKFSNPFALELRSNDNLWHVAWCVAASSSPSSIEIARQYADCIGLSDRTTVKVRVVSNLPKATLVTVEPLTEDDWEILELNSELAESVILKQVGVVHEQMKFPLWLHGQTVVMFLVLSTFPQNPVVQLVPGTEVAVAPKRRKNSSLQSTDESHTIAKAQLRVQDSDNRFIYKYEDNGIEMDIMFTSGVFVHPETATKYCFTSHQLVEISPRSQFKNSKKRLQSRSKSNEKEANNGNHTDKGDFPHHVIVHILLCESVSKGHIMLAQSLRLYLGAELHSWVHVKGCNISANKDIPPFSISPYHFKTIEKNEYMENSSPEVVSNHKYHQQKDMLNSIGSNAEMGITDWSMHDKVVAVLSSGSSHDGAEGTVIKTGERQSKGGHINGLSYLLRVWCLAQLDTRVSNSAEDVISLIIGSKNLLHLKIKYQRLPRNCKIQTSSEKFPRNRNQAEETSIDILYMLSPAEESLQDKDYNAYELAFDKGSSGNYTSKSLDMLLEKLQLGDILFYRVASLILPDNVFGAAPSSLDWMGTAPIDVTHRLTSLLSPTDGMLFSIYNLPLPGHILICGPAGSGKTSLAKASAKYIEGCKDILAHVVFVSCSRLTLEKPSTIRQMLSSNISEALDHAPSVIILDDLDSLVASSSDLEGSQPSSSSAAIIEFLADLLDEARLLFCVCVCVCVMNLMGPDRKSKKLVWDWSHCIHCYCAIPGEFSTELELFCSGRFDFHVNLPAPAAAERSAILKHEIEKRSLQCTDDLLSDIASKCDGYDAYDLEILVDRSVHAAIGRSLSAGLGSKENEKPTLVRDDFLQAMENFLPVAMRDITKPATEGGRSGWEDVGGLNDIRNAIKEMIELPSRFPNIFAEAPLRLRSNVLLYGPPGCGKTHIVGAAAAACSLRFISVKGPELLNKYIGASEQAVRDIFSKAAAAAPCLLFFDEFDSIAPKRGHDNTGVTDRVVNQFLTELDGVEVLTGVFVFAATSRPDLLDAALLRPGRLDRLLFCNFPSQQERLDILNVLSRKLPMDSDVVLDHVAQLTEGFSGADLQALLSDTQLEAVHELLDNNNGSSTGKMPVITNALLKSVASKAKPSVSEDEKRRLYAIYSQFLDSKRSAAAQVLSLSLSMT